MKQIYFSLFSALVLFSLASCDSKLKKDIRTMENDIRGLVDAIHYLNTKIQYEQNQVFIIDGYKAIKVENTIWMAENLNTDSYANGEKIIEVRDEKEWRNLKEGAWCYYNNDEAHGKKYGKLYNWYAVSDPRGLCPSGWKVASNEDWTNLINFYGGRYLASYALSSDTAWNPPNGSNHSGFNALPGGYRPNTNESEDDFDGLSGGVWWTSTNDNPIFGFINIKGAWGMDICPQNTFNAKNGWYVGESVRCVKNPEYD